MKICVFCHDAYMSGASLALYDWLVFDSKNDYMVVLPHKNKNSPFCLLPNVEVVYGNYFCLVKELKKNTFKFQAKKIVKILYQIFLGGLFRYITKKIVENWEPDIILTNSFTLLEGARIAKKLEKPHVWHVREFMELDHQVTHYNGRLVKELCSCSNAIFISKSVEKYYHSKGYNFLSTKVIYDQVKINDYSKIHDEIYFINNEIKMMIVGILQENKGQLEAIKIAEALNDKGYLVHLDIYGEGPNYGLIKKYIDVHKLGFVELKGFCSDIMERRPLYDISLVCSKNEAFGRVTVESMWAKNITVAVKAGASLELLKDKETGYLYELGNIEECCHLIEEIVCEKDINKLTECAHDFAEKNYCQPIYQVIIDYFNECIDS